MTATAPLNFVASLTHPKAISLEPHWYALYTSARHEKRVAEHLCQRSTEYFLPLYQSVRRWKDRKVVLQLPLFPGYVFVRIATRDRLDVLRVPGVSRLVGFDSSPAALPDEEIETIRAALARGVHAEPHRALAAGQRVFVRSGPMTGLRGILQRRKSRSRLIVSLEFIQRAMAVEIDESDIEPAA